MPRLRLKTVLNELRLRMRAPGSRFQEMPYDYGSKLRTFSEGVMLYTQQPEAKRLESVRLRSSGKFKLIRVFPEEFENGTLQQSSTKLPLARIRRMSAQEALRKLPQNRYTYCMIYILGERFCAEPGG